MKFYHHDHHGEHDHGHHHDHHDHEEVSVDLSELEKARILLAHMLDHNRHHEEEMAHLAERFETAGNPAAAKKVRAARARMVEANLALMEAVGLAAPKEEAGRPAEPQEEGVPAQGKEV